MPFSCRRLEVTHAGRFSPLKVTIFGHGSSLGEHWPKGPKDVVQGYSLANMMVLLEFLPWGPACVDRSLLPRVRGQPKYHLRQSRLDVLLYSSSPDAIVFSPSIPSSGAIWWSRGITQAAVH